MQQLLACISTTSCAFYVDEAVHFIEAVQGIEGSK